MHIDTNQSRRTFLRRASQLGAAGAAAPLLTSLGAISDAAAAATSSEYKALVCVFLYGGNDHANTLPPYDGASYNAYQSARPSLAVRRNQLAGTMLNATNDLGGRQFALHPNLRALMPIFNEGKMAPLLNIGNLVEPTTKAQYRNESVRLPPKLFSHNDQQSFAQSFEPEGADAGWGGRIGDMIRSSNGASALTSVTLGGNAVWMSGQSTTPYTASARGVTELLWKTTHLYGSGHAYNVLKQLMANDSDGWIATEHARVGKRAIDLSETVSAALRRAPAKNFTTFPRSPLADDLKMIARLISAGPSLGLRRQVFFASMGGFDTHSGLNRSHPDLLRTLGDALAGFYRATEKLGVADQVTTFTASDFGRTLSQNGDGSDHGWGGTQFVLGGAVKGKQIYGTPPEIGLNTNDDVDSGRLIPTTSVDQFAATLALWFGVPPSDVGLVLPNLPNFNPSSWDLGFLH